MSVAVAVVYDRAMSTDNNRRLSTAARNGGVDIVEDLETIEELETVAKKTHHMIIREFPTWIEPPKTAFDFGHQRRTSQNAENPATNTRCQSHNNHQNLTNQNIHYQQFLHHLGSLSYEKPGKIK